MADHTPPTAVAPNGPWFHRFLIGLFSVLLTILLYWLLGFLVDDLGNLPGPSYQALERELLDPELLSTRNNLRDQIGEVERSIANEQTRQRLLRESTSSSQTTLNQLLDIQRISLEQNTDLPEEQQQALVESERLFLENQKKDQQLTDSITQLNERRSELKEQQRLNELALQVQRQPIQEKFQQLTQDHRLRVAAWKLSLLVPLLLVAAALFLVQRRSIYRPLIYALGIATLIKTFEVMHRYFPARYFKYALVASAIAAVTIVLIYLLRSRARPSRDTLFKQYREAYESFLCPVCSFPIRRGPLRFAAWTRRSIKRLRRLPDASDDSPYTCPACSTTLFAACPECGATRHSLLPACHNCGAMRDVS